LNKSPNRLKDVKKKAIKNLKGLKKD
jgi:hypothetical protein